MGNATIKNDQCSKHPIGNKQLKYLKKWNVQPNVSYMTRTKYVGVHLESYKLETDLNRLQKKASNSKKNQKKNCKNPYTTIA
jgi:hypothetical protein